MGSTHARRPATTGARRTVEGDGALGRRNDNALPYLAGRCLCGEGGSGDDLLSPARGPTIIGAGAFHGPVRDGKGWFHSAMVARRKRGSGDR